MGQTIIWPRVGASNKDSPVDALTYYDNNDWFNKIRYKSKILLLKSINNNDTINNSVVLLLWMEVHISRNTIHAVMRWAANVTDFKIETTFVVRNDEAHLLIQ